MSDNKVISIPDRLDKLHQLLKIVGMELQDIHNAMINEKIPSTPTLTLPPASPLSSEGIDLEAMVKRVDVSLVVQSSKAENNLPLTDTAKVIAIKNDNLIPVSGFFTLFQKYLSPQVYTDGRGFIKPNKTFGQYEEDIAELSYEYLRPWPSGFYRNKDTKETQLLVNVQDKYIFVVDHLPGTIGTIRVVTYSGTVSFESTAVVFGPMNASGINTSEFLKEALELLETELKQIITRNNM
jgi:hypothetical protein